VTGKDGLQALEVAREILEKISVSSRRLFGG
jgi:hypothetical protein